MEFITVTAENIDREHICCAISGNGDVQVTSKKAWLKDRFAQGLVFLKSAERGKCFIEYIPAEYAWAPIDGAGYMYIDCFWVAGSLKGHGYSNQLLDACIQDSREKGKLGLCVLSSEKKRPFLSDPGYLRHRGFQVADSSDTGIQLMYLPFEATHEPPRFREAARHPRIEEQGFVLYYTSQCPFNAKYVPLLEAAAKEHGIPFHGIHIDTVQQAQALPSPCTTYALFHDGKFLTNEQQSVPKFLKQAGVTI